MTVTYSLAVADARFLPFTRLLFRWRGSIYKLVLGELMIFAALYYFIMMISRVALNAKQQEYFGHLCLYFRDWLNLVPITFVLGFYVSLIITRWWNIYDNLPWPDRIAVLLNAYVHGADERGRLIRRNMIRYLHIMGILCLRCVSTASRKRFPTLDHMVDAKIMTADEKVLLESVSGTYGNYFQPAFWFGTLAAEARQEGRIRSDEALKQIMEEIGRYRMWMGNLMSYDWVSVPLVYTQVVSIAIYAFFFGCLFGRQYLQDEDEKYWVSQYFPLFTFIQFFFYRGWMKVAEVMINPLGEDDDDFEVNYLVDRNVAVGFIMVDDLYGKRPPVVRDPHWNQSEPLVPYTTASVDSIIPPFMGSATGMQVPTRTQDWVSEESLTARLRTKSRVSASKGSIVSEDTNSPAQPNSVPAFNALRKASRDMFSLSRKRRISRGTLRRNPLETNNRLVSVSEDPEAESQLAAKVSGADVAKDLTTMVSDAPTATLESESEHENA